MGFFKFYCTLSGSVSGRAVTLSKSIVSNTECELHVLRTSKTHPASLKSLLTLVVFQPANRIVSSLIHTTRKVVEKWCVMLSGYQDADLSYCTQQCQFAGDGRVVKSSDRLFPTLSVASFLFTLPLTSMLSKRSSPHRPPLWWWHRNLHQLVAIIIILLIALAIKLRMLTG